MWCALAGVPVLIQVNVRLETLTRQDDVRRTSCRAVREYEILFYRYNI